MTEHLLSVQKVQGSISQHLQVEMREALIWNPLTVSVDNTELKEPVGLAIRQQIGHLTFFKVQI